VKDRNDERRRHIFCEIEVVCYISESLQMYGHRGERQKANEMEAYVVPNDRRQTDGQFSFEPASLGSLTGARFRRVLALH
jgi:hypothetical protein